MTLSVTRLACLLLAASTLSTPSFAESFASSASSAGSQVSGSVSDSLQGSSNSSSRKTDVADGNYRVIEVAAVADRPGMLRLKMLADGQQGEAAALWLDLPQQALAQRAVAAGDVVRASHRPYGYEFAHADTRQPFFLVLADDWRRELDSNAVQL